MPKYIIRLDTTKGAKYLEYSTITDTPITSAMTREAFEAYYLEEYGRSSMHTLKERMERVDRKGTSSRRDSSAEDTVSHNRAGFGWTCMTFTEFVAWYGNDDACGDRWEYRPRGTYKNNP